METMTLAQAKARTEQIFEAIKPGLFREQNAEGWGRGFDYWAEIRPDKESYLHALFNKNGRFNIKADNGDSVVLLFEAQLTDVPPGPQTPPKPTPRTEPLPYIVTINANPPAFKLVPRR